MTRAKVRARHTTHQIIVKIVSRNVHKHAYSSVAVICSARVSQRTRSSRRDAARRTWYTGQLACTTVPSGTASSVTGK